VPNSQPRTPLAPRGQLRTPPVARGQLRTAQMPRGQFKAPQVPRGRIWTADAGTYGPGVRPEPRSHRDADGTAAALGDCVRG